MANQQAPAASTALAAPTKEERLARLPGAYRDPKQITERLQFAASNFHLVSPATACGAIPEGCSIALTTVIIDPANETYDVGGGKVGLAKVALDKISAAAGISWDPRQSGRLDNGSDPNYCAWRAVGRMRHLDGTWVQIVESKEMDLRPGSPQVVALEERAKAKRPPGDAAKQIREMRLHIMAHAETKARLRAIRSIGIRSAYRPDELKKPFVVAKIMWTGQSDDPELRRAFAMKQADAMLGGASALGFGEGPAQAQPQAPLSAPLGALRPPPIGQSFGEERDEPPARLSSGAARTVDAPPPSEPKAADAGSAPPAAAKPQPTTTDAPKVPVARFGRSKDLPLTEMEDEQLEWYVAALRENVDDPKKSRFKAENEAHLAECMAEFKRRNADANSDAGDY